MFVQATQAAGLPPIVNAAMLLAERGWGVTVLTAPFAGQKLDFPAHPAVRVCAMPERPSHVMSKPSYFHYAARAIGLARRLRPQVVYASDLLGAGPGLLAARAAGARLVYHEHDSPPPAGAGSLLRRLRARAARSAHLVVFPNEERARFAQDEIGFAPDRLRIVWNLPRRSEIPPLAGERKDSLILYYHGSITPERLPHTVAAAVRRGNGAVRLHVAGYEITSSSTYLNEFIAAGSAGNGERLVRYLGLLPLHEQLLVAASEAHVGLALMPQGSADVNMQHMTGASNKIYDYMAAGLVPLVSDLPDWRSMFVATGFARSCDPASVDSIVSALAWFRDNPRARHEMGAQNRAKILHDWNYDTAFSPVIDTFETWANA